MKSFKPEFQIDGQWYDNALRFVSRFEAELNASDKFMRRTMPSAYRVSESPDEPNYTYSPDGVLERIKGAA